MPTQTHSKQDLALTCRDMRGRDISHVVAMTGRLAAHHGETATLTAEILQREAFSSAPLVKILVAEINGVLVGYAALVPTLQLQFGARGMELHHLHVDETVRGRGVGRALVAAAIERARGVGCFFVTVGTHAGNERARQFYARCGFEPVVTGGARLRIALGEGTGIRLAG